MIDVGIMAVYERAPKVYKMLYRLRQQGLEPRVVWDKHHAGSLINARRFWSTVEQNAGVLLQDDTIIPDGFAENLTAIAEYVEEVRYEGFVAGFIMNPWYSWDWLPEGVRWIASNYMTGQCTIARKPVADRFHEWVDEVIDPRRLEPTYRPGRMKQNQHGVRQVSDDEAMTLFMQWHGMRVYHAYPCIVDHDATEESLQSKTDHRRVAPAVAEKSMTWPPFGEAYVNVPRNWEWPKRQWMFREQYRK